MHGQTPVHGTSMYSCAPILKPNEQVATHAKHMINNARAMPLPIQMHVKGGSDFQCVVTHGG